MAQIVDARGFSCPQPVLMTMAEIKKTGKGQIEVLVDTDTSKKTSPVRPPARDGRFRMWRRKAAGIGSSSRRTPDVFFKLPEKKTTPKEQDRDRGILVFENTSEVIRAENALKRAGWDVKVKGPLQRSALCVT